MANDAKPHLRALQVNQPLLDRLQLRRQVGAELLQRHRPRWLAKSLQADRQRGRRQQGGGVPRALQVQQRQLHKETAGGQAGRAGGQV